MQWSSAQPLCLGVWLAGPCSTSDGVLVLGAVGQVTSEACRMRSVIVLARGLLRKETALSKFCLEAQVSLACQRCGMEGKKGWGV